ncbi:MAG TPA: DUF4258 domain-containing protein [Thermomicrobiales bacterium]|nr:DUF4258 domain-containing protein [Thermomicrobiales bacterium]
MPIFDAIIYSWHARQRMKQRRIAAKDVELALRIGEGHPGDDGTWIYELGDIRVVIVDADDATAHIVTVIRLRNRT